jgi:hypothetical protein
VTGLAAVAVRKRRTRRFDREDAGALGIDGRVGSDKVDEAGILAAVVAVVVEAARVAEGEAAAVEWVSSDRGA